MRPSPPRNGRPPHAALRAPDDAPHGEAGTGGLPDILPLLRDLLNLPRMLEKECAAVFQPVLSGLARTLMLSECRHSLAVEKAVRQHRQAVEDAGKFAEHARHLPADAAGDLRNRGKRLVNAANATLTLVGVTVREPRLGELFDPAYHVERSCVPTSDPSENGRVAEAFSDAYLWRDEFGNEQLKPAAVAVFEYHAPPAEENADGRRSS